MMLWQSAYRMHHSAESVTQKIAYEIFDAMDDCHVTLLVLLDLSTAFDTVDYDILIHRLDFSCDISGTALHWICFFVSGRVQVVLITSL